MTIVDFTADLLEEAKALANENYEEEKGRVEALPNAKIEWLDYFTTTGCSAAALDGEKLIGFLGFCAPWDNAFDNPGVKAVFSPIHAHAAIAEKREEIYHRMYQYAAERHYNLGVRIQAVSLYAHDISAKNAFFTFSFGGRCMDAIRKTGSFGAQKPDGIEVRILKKGEEPLIRAMRKELSLHLSKSPCFMPTTEEDFKEWIERAEGRSSRLFTAFDGETPVGFIEVTTEGAETFISELDCVANIQGAYCLPEYRGRGIMPYILDRVSEQCKKEGFTALGVDYECMNVNAYSFWGKYFEPYTVSVIRRIDG